MDRGIWWRLAGMMALVSAVQGSFWPLLAVHLQDLGIDGRWRGAIFATMALGSMAMPLGAGQLVDRRLATQHFLALAYALGAGLLAALAWGAIVVPGALFAIFLVYWLVIAPTIGLSASLALRNLPRPAEQFGGVRLWGTIGWMAVGWLVTGVLMWSGASRAGRGTFEAFGLAAVLSALLSVYCLTLPNTPPLAVGARGASGPREALELIRRPWVAVFLATAFGVCLTTPFLYQVQPPYLESRGLPRAWISTVMTLGQYPEIVALAALPRMFRRLRYKGTLALGIAAYFVRYASLAFDPPLWVAIAGIPLQGVGVACFTVGGQVFFDSQAPAHRRASAQALMMVLTSGIGSLLGSLLAGEMSRHFPGDYPLVFLILGLITFGLLVTFWVGFRPDQATSEEHAHRPSWSEANIKPASAPSPVGNLATEPADG
jgi:nucleoside H+ symporter